MLATMAVLLMIATPDTSAASPRRNSDEDPERVVCRQTEPVLGSRVARRRICRTVAEWRSFEEDRAQMRRDFNAGNCNGHESCSERLLPVSRPAFGPR